MAIRKPHKLYVTEFHTGRIAETTYETPRDADEWLTVHYADHPTWNVVGNALSARIYADNVLVAEATVGKVKRGEWRRKHSATMSQRRKGMR